MIGIVVGAACLIVGIELGSRIDRDVAARWQVGIVVAAFSINVVIGIGQWWR